MKANILLTFCFAAIFAGSVSAQDTTKTTEIRQSVGIILDETGKILTALGEEGGEILKSDSLRDAIANEIERAMEKLDEADDKLEEAADKLEDMEDRVEDKEINLSIGDDDDDDDDDKCESKDKRTKSFVMFGTGLNNWDFGGPAPAGYIQPDFGRSWFIDLGYQYRTRIGGPKSPVAIRWGYGFLFNKYDLGNNTMKTGDDGKTNFVALDSSITFNSKLRTTSFYIPLMLDFKLLSHLHLGVGGYGDVRIGNGNTRIKYDAGDDEQKQVLRDELNLNRFNYGLMASLGKRDWRVYGRYSLDQQFAANGPQGINPWSVGLVWAL